MTKHDWGMPYRDVGQWKSTSDSPTYTLPLPVLLIAYRSVGPPNTPPEKAPMMPIPVRPKTQGSDMVRKWNTGATVGEAIEMRATAAVRRDK
ncbi:hypothetical protein PSPO01_08517 [Paraphaeosphaeria sporulosa]